MFMSWLVAVLTAFAIAAPMIYMQNRTIREGLESKVSNVAAHVALQVRLWYEKIAKNEVDPDDTKCLKVSAREGDYDYVALSTLSGVLLYRNGQWEQKDNLTGALWSPVMEQDKTSGVVENPFGEGKALHYREAFYNEDHLVGWIHVGSSMDHYQRSVEQVYSLTGMVALSVIVLSAVVSLFLARQITRPIRTLQTYAQSVSAGASNARVKISSNDEIQDLADSINTMVDNLQNSQHKLKESMEEKQAMREQEILLREIHHRVKNNMQILTSLLRLQTRRADSEQLRTVLMESEARIRSMGLLHEKLYQSDSVSEIDIAGYFKTLTSELVRMKTPQGEKREIRLVVRGIKLGLDTALPCGLIVTELVSNSLKYAFPNPGSQGVILICLSQTQEGEYALTVWDNGVGIPEDYKERQSDSLGSRLVAMLTDQLNGTLDVNGDRGTRTAIKFKEIQYRRRI